jgi:hypothetical protein
MTRLAPIKKAKKSCNPRASTGSTHHGMRYAGSKPFSSTKIAKKVEVASAAFRGQCEGLRRD